MSQENVELVRRSFEAIRRWDVEALCELYDPDITFLPLTGTRVESGGYRGHSGVRRYFDEIADIWVELRPYESDIRTTGSHVVVLGGCAVRGRGSGAQSDTPMAWVLTVRDGKITSHRGYGTREQALEAVGLSE